MFSSAAKAIPHEGRHNDVIPPAAGDFLRVSSASSIAPGPKARFVCVECEELNKFFTAVDLVKKLDSLPHLSRDHRVLRELYRSGAFCFMPSCIRPIFKTATEACFLSTLFGIYPFLQKLVADGGYQGPVFQKALAKTLPHLEIEIVKRPDHAKAFEVLSQRRVVYRTYDRTRPSRHKNLAAPSRSHMILAIRTTR